MKPKLWYTYLAGWLFPLQCGWLGTWRQICRWRRKRQREKRKKERGREITVITIIPAIMVHYSTVLPNCLLTHTHKHAEHTQEFVLWKSGIMEKQSVKSINRYHSQRDRPENSGWPQNTTHKLAQKTTSIITTYLLLLVCRTLLNASTKHKRILSSDKLALQSFSHFLRIFTSY